MKYQVIATGNFSQVFQSLQYPEGSLAIRLNFWHPDMIVFIKWPTPDSEITEPMLIQKTGNIAVSYLPSCVELLSSQWELVEIDDDDE